MCLLGGSNQLVNFEMQNVIVAVLRILDKKYHQERDDGRRRVNDELPCVVVMEVRPCGSPRCLSKR